MFVLYSMALAIFYYGFVFLDGNMIVFQMIFSLNSLEPLFMLEHTDQPCSFELLCSICIMNVPFICWWNVQGGLFFLLQTWLQEKGPFTSLFIYI